MNKETTHLTFLWQNTNERIYNIIETTNNAEAEQQAKIEVKTRNSMPTKAK